MDKNRDSLKKLLEEKISFIDELLKEPNWDLLRQWKEEALMILDNLIGEESKYYSSFQKLDYRASVFSMGDEEGNRIRNEEAYREDLERAKGSLKAIIYGIEKGLI